MSDDEKPKEQGAAAPALKRAFEKAADYNPNFFPVEIGLDAQKYHQRKPAEYAGVKFFAEQGWIHGVHGRAAPLENGGTRVVIDHWVHRPGGENVVTRFLEIEAVPAQTGGKAVMRVSKVAVQGEAIDINDRRAVNAAVSTCQQAMETLRLERRMPVLSKIADSAGLKTKPLTDTYKDGNARMAYEAGRKSVNRMLRIPRQFLPAVTAFFEDGYEAVQGTPVLFSATARDPNKGGSDYAFYGALDRLQAEGAYNVTLKLARRKQEHGEAAYTERDVVRLRFRPCRSARNQGLVELADVQMDGRSQRPSDHKNMVRMLHFAHDAMLHARHGAMPDLAEIVSYTNTQRAFSGLPDLTKAEGQRYTYRVLGGNPSNQNLFAQEGGIGANCFLHLYEWFDEKGHYKSDAIMVDCGIVGLRRNVTGFDGSMPFAGAYFEHRNNPKHKPQHKVGALMVTHHHLDHYGGLPHLLLAGYIVDHVICNEATKMYIEEACKKLEVPAAYMPKKWSIIDREMDMKVGAFDLSFGWIPHSAITNWVNVKTPEGSTFHFSDAKVDPTIKSHNPMNPARIAAMKPTVAVVDSTRAMQTEETEHEEVIEQRVVDFMNENPDKGVIAFHIGSNAARMSGFVNAYGRTGRDTVVFGAAKRFLKKVLERVGLRSEFNDKAGGAKFGLKALARSHGREVVNFSPKAKLANEILAGDLGAQGLLATGTHNEVMSIANRLIENKDMKNLGFITPQKYVVILSQTGIPGSTREFNQFVDWLERRGFTYKIIHASGHEGRKGILKMLDWAKAKYGLVSHGSTGQRSDAADIVKASGMIPVDPAAQDVVQVSDKKGCKIIAQEPSTRVYFSIKRPEDQHYGGGEDVEYYAHVAPPEMRSETGDMINDIARLRPAIANDAIRMRHVRDAAPRRDPILNMDGSSLRPRNKRVHISLPDYLIQNGILRRVVFDCETTQLGRHAWITQFSARQSEWFGADGDTPKRINIRQTLPRKVVPDLNALLITGVAPSDLYATGPDYYPPRQFYHKIDSFLQESRKIDAISRKNGVEHTESHKRIWIDADQTPQDPTRKVKASGDAANPYLVRSMDYAFERHMPAAEKPEGSGGPAKAEERFKNPRAVTIKTMVGGFNNIKADDVWLAHAAFRAGSLRYAPTNTAGMRRFDLRNMARMYAYLRPDEFKVRKKPDNPAFFDFTVEGLMKANNLGYEKYKAHDAAGDVDMEDDALLGHMLKIDPELYTQAMLNSNPKEVKKFLAGTHNGMLYPRHLLTYINVAAKDARANIGVYVGRSTDRKTMNRALIFNVSDFDPKDFLGMSVQEISEIMGDPKHRLHKAFEVVHLNQQPLLASADRGFAVGANRNTSLEAMKGYKHFIERHPQMAATMIRAMEMAKPVPDHDPRAPMETRLYAPAFMEMSSHDKTLAKLFEPVEQEFTDQSFARKINRERAQALDGFHSVQARERYVAVLYQAEQEFGQIFGVSAKFLHAEDRAREQAREKARLHGLIDSDAMSIGRLEKQINDARANWDKMMAGKTAEEKARAETILTESRQYVDFVKERVALNDPEWALTREDYALLGLDDNVAYGAYRPPLSRNTGPRARSPKPRAA